MRCDLHVHTRHSGMCTVPLLNRVCRESYSEPQQLYETLKGRGMDLVTVTDHDSIDAVEQLRRHPDFFLSEEVTATTPGGTEVHVGVYDMQELHHTGIQRRRNDLPALSAYLSERRLFFTINHVYSSLTGKRTDDDFALFARHFPGMEVLNGQIPALNNRRAGDLAESWGKAGIGGSDAHTLAALGRTYTRVNGARTKREFLDGLRAGRATLHGESGGYWKLTSAVWKLGISMMRENRWTLALLPLAPLVPIITLANCVRELAFVSRWAPRVCRPQTRAASYGRSWMEPRNCPEEMGS
jgi:predicted metal-dependent phosphoesterase TrpH